MYRQFHLRVHTRICGTNSFVLVRLRQSIESPPHTRDKCLEPSLNHESCRITPAYAGQIPKVGFFENSPWDHPRIRGTNLPPNAAPPLPPGSSPHTRDKSSVVPHSVFSIGIIPAYAGQIFRWGSCPHLTEDHPRIRGTNLMIGGDAV